MENHEDGGKTARVWHLSYSGKKEGPYSIEEARKVVARKGKFNAFCWTTGMESWSPIEAHPDFLRSDSVGEPERRVSWPLAAGIFIAPYVFVWWLLRKGHGNIARIIGFSWFAVIMVAILSEHPEVENPAGSLAGNTSSKAAASSTTRSGRINNLEDARNRYVSAPEDDNVFSLLRDIKEAKANPKDKDKMAKALEAVSEIIKIWPAAAEVIPETVTPGECAELATQFKSLSPLQVENAKIFSRSHRLLDEAMKPFFDGLELLSGPNRIGNYDIENSAFTLSPASLSTGQKWDIGFLAGVKSREIKIAGEVVGSELVLPINDKGLAAQMERASDAYSISKLEWSSREVRSPITGEYIKLYWVVGKITDVFVVERATGMVIWPYRGKPPEAVQDQ